MTQCGMILDYLQHHQGITHAEAQDLFGCYRLSGRIFDLKERGHKFKVFKEKSINRYGKTVNYARYVLADE